MHVERISAETAAEASRIYVFAWQAGYRGIIPQPYLDALSPEQWRPRLETSIYKDFLLTDGKSGCHLFHISGKGCKHAGMGGNHFSIRATGAFQKGIRQIFIFV